MTKEKAEEIKYLRFATEEDKTKRDLFKLALDRRYLINDLVKENAELKKQLEVTNKENERIKKQWHDCFLSCSSPYCAAHFPAVEMQGELGNMSKREPEG